jgi:hypothetical protein
MEDTQYLAGPSQLVSIDVYLVNLSFHRMTSQVIDLIDRPIPRFSIANDKYEEVRSALIKYYARGDKNPELVASELVQIKATIDLELEKKKMT